MSRARISVRAEVDWTAQDDSSAVLLVRAAHAHDQEIVEETLVVEGARVEEGPDDRPLQSSSRLPFALLPWTLPSRYAPSDLLGATAQAELGLGPRARALLPVAAEWVRTRIDYIPGVSDALTSADETLLRRQGVCRDMAHLAVSLLRALEIPARVVACYAPLLEPPDFHALVEAHDGEAWRLMDATGLAPVETIVRVASGRDAADIAWATGDGALELDDLRVAAANMGPPG